MHGLIRLVVFEGRGLALQGLLVGIINHNCSCDMARVKHSEKSVIKKHYFETKLYFIVLKTEN